MPRIGTLLLCCVEFVFTSQAQTPVNDLCADAIAITCGQSIAGNTTEATTDDEAVDCGTSVSAVGVWYTFEGTGDALTLSTCEGPLFDTKINVYAGTCGELSCVTGNDDGGDCGTGSTIAFPSAIGTTYFILVQGYDGAVGEFQLAASCGPISNDFCDGATAMSCFQSSNGSTVGASLDLVPFCETSVQAPGIWYTFTGISDAVVMSTCESSTFDTRINVYTGTCSDLVCVTGNDDTPGAGLCSTVNFAPSEDQTYYILVQGYDGETGEFSLELACVSCGPPTDIEAFASDVTASVFWNSLNPGATYFIEYGPLGFTPGTGLVVSGPVVGAMGSAAISGLNSDTEYAFYIREECGPGDVSATVGALTFTTLAEPPPVNANCSGALPITCGMDVDGDTGLSFFQPGTTCGAAPVSSPGLWYTFEGTGETVTLSTCDLAEYDTKISVYVGDCGALDCVVGGDDAVGCGDNTSLVVFPSEIGISYRILVHGYNGGSGTFTLSMTCAQPCSPLALNDACSGAVQLPVAGIGLCSPVQGSNACAFADGAPNPPCDPYIPIVDVWYTFTTNGAPTTNLYIAALSAGEVNAAVYEDCGSLTYIGCEIGINGPWVLNTLSPNTTYILRVWNGGGEDEGSFAVCLEADITTAVIEAPKVNTVRIWPNPANDRISIDGLNSLHVDLVDPQGRVIAVTPTFDQGVLTVDIGSLAQGLYIVRTREGITIGRFVKE
ncbi:MAG: T9SS type A sorting domain-containing protein [Flavobacteriales bacterium]|nr:T9SS type A sorting domain-containing protein [Flavobacteriales bacterium]MBK8707814.1 T9SS type A sorting domain-containing protein [Flavobacteriales bacterium]